MTLNAGVVLANMTASTLKLTNATTSLVNLAGTGVQDTVNSLVIGGVAQPAGTYGATGNLLATNTAADFAGTGLLTVLAGPAAVPEPSTWAMLGVGVAGLGVVTLRQRARRA